MVGKGVSSGGGGNPNCSFSGSAPFPCTDLSSVSVQAVHNNSASADMAQGWSNMAFYNDNGSQVGSTETLINYLIASQTVNRTVSVPSGATWFRLNCGGSIGYKSTSLSESITITAIA